MTMCIAEAAWARLWCLVSLRGDTEREKGREGGWGLKEGPLLVVEEVKLLHRDGHSTKV